MKELKRVEHEGRSATVRLMLKVANLSSGAWYARRPCKATDQKQKPGPQVAFSDEKVLSEVRAYLADPYFSGEGYKKLWKRLKDRGVTVGKERLRRILGENNLLAPQRPQEGTGGYSHEGTITTDAPNTLYGIDIKEWKCKSGKCWTITIIDHFNAEVIAQLTVKSATTDKVMEVTRQAIKKRFGALTKDICKGLELEIRTDNGSQFIAKEFAREVQFLGIFHTRTAVASPESNGIIERYHRTIKEQIVYKILEATFGHTIEIIDEFNQRYNQHWLIHRLGLVSPIEFRKSYENTLVLA